MSRTNLIAIWYFFFISINCSKKIFDLHAFENNSHFHFLKVLILLLVTQSRFSMQTRLNTDSNWIQKLSLYVCFLWSCCFRLWTHFTISIFCSRPQCIFPRERREIFSIFSHEENLAENYKLFFKLYPCGNIILVFGGEACLILIQCYRFRLVKWGIFAVFRECRYLSKFIQVYLNFIFYHESLNR